MHAAKVTSHSGASRAARASAARRSADAPAAVERIGLPPKATVSLADSAASRADASARSSISAAVRRRPKPTMRASSSVGWPALMRTYRPSSKCEVSTSAIESESAGVVTFTCVASHRVRLVYVHHPGRDAPGSTGAVIASKSAAASASRCAASVPAAAAQPAVPLPLQVALPPPAVGCRAVGGGRRRRRRRRRRGGGER